MGRCRPSIRLSSTVMCGKSSTNWNARPTPSVATRWGGRSWISRPSSRIVPPVGRTKPPTTFRNEEAMKRAETEILAKLFRGLGDVSRLRVLEIDAHFAGAALEGSAGACASDRSAQPASERRTGTADP